MERTLVCFPASFPSAILWERDLLFVCGGCDSCGGISQKRVLCGEPMSDLVDVVFALTTFDSVQYLLVGWLFKIWEWNA